MLIFREIKISDSRIFIAVYFLEYRVILKSITFGTPFQVFLNFEEVKTNLYRKILTLREIRLQNYLLRIICIIIKKDIVTMNKFFFTIIQHIDAINDVLL